MGPVEKQNIKHSDSGLRRALKYLGLWSLVVLPIPVVMIVEAIDTGSTASLCEYNTQLPNAGWNRIHAEVARTLRTFGYCPATLTPEERLLIPGIVDYRPVDFQEKAARPFFYTINNQLRHGVSIDPNTPLLFVHHALSPDDSLRVYPSPDNTKAAIVSNEKLYLIRPDQPPRLLLDRVDIPLKLWSDEWWYRSEFLQWDKSSRYLTIVQDQKNSVSEKTYRGSTSEIGRLFRLDTVDFTPPEKIVDGFHASYAAYTSRYFQVGERTICFLGKFGDGKWKCATPSGVFRMISYDGHEMILENGQSLTDPPFISVDHHQNLPTDELALPVKPSHFIRHTGLVIRHIKSNADIHYDGVFSENDLSKPLLVRKRGKYDSKYRAFNTRQSVALPGGRYIFLDIVFLGSPKLLLDRQTGNYRALPDSARVYVNDAHRINAGQSLPYLLWKDRFPQPQKDKETPKQQKENETACGNAQTSDKTTAAQKPCDAPSNKKRSWRRRLRIPILLFGVSVSRRAFRDLGW